MVTSHGLAATALSASAHLTSLKHLDLSNLDAPTFSIPEDPHYGILDLPWEVDAHVARLQELHHLTGLTTSRLQQLLPLNYSAEDVTALDKLTKMQQLCLGVRGGYCSEEHGALLQLASLTNLAVDMVSDSSASAVLRKLTNLKQLAVREPSTITNSGLRCLSRLRQLTYQPVVRPRLL